MFKPMKKEAMDRYFKTYFVEGQAYELMYLCGLYSRALQEYCYHFSNVCMYAEETSAGVIPDENQNAIIKEEMDAMVCAASHLERQKYAFLKKANSADKECAVTELYNFDASEFCVSGSAYVKNGILEGAKNLSIEKMKYPAQHVPAQPRTASELNKFEQAMYLMMLCPQKEVG